MIGDAVVTRRRPTVAEYDAHAADLDAHTKNIFEILLLVFP